MHLPLSPCRCLAQRFHGNFGEQDKTRAERSSCSLGWQLAFLDALIPCSNCEAEKIRSFKKTVTLWVETSAVLS